MAAPGADPRSKVPKFGEEAAAMKKDTRLVTAGRKPEENFGIVNPPVYHASTITFPTVAAMEKACEDRFEVVYYGRYGTPTTFAFEDAVAALEGGEKTIAVPSGLAAIAGPLLTLLKTGDHVLMVDTVYQPTRKLCDGTLADFGVETTYYDPMIGRGIAELMRPRTKVVFVEAPGSLTFEVQDVPAIAEEAHKAGATVVMDNTWSAGYYFQPFEHRRRCLGPGRHQVHRRTFRCHVGGHHDQPRTFSDHQGAGPSRSAMPPPPTTAIWVCAACAAWPPAWPASRRRGSRWRAGWRPARRSPKSATRPFRTARAMNFGSEISPVLQAFSEFY